MKAVESYVVTVTQGIDAFNKLSEADFKVTKMKFAKKGKEPTNQRLSIIPKYPWLTSL